MPGFRSATFSTPSRKLAVLKAGRGSRPGFSSSRKMSVTVGTPNTASVNASGSIGVAPMYCRSVPSVRSVLPQECVAPRDRLQGVRPTNQADRLRWKCAGILPKGPSRGTFFEIRPVAKRTGPLTVSDKAAGQSFADPRDSRQRRRRGSVDVNTHGVDTILYHRIEGARKFVFAKIMLILAHADRLGINFGQFGERVLKPPCDRHCSSQGFVQVRQLLRGESRSGVHRGARL